MSGPHVGGSSKTRESSERSIHDEGLPEHPIKNWKIGGVRQRPASPITYQSVEERRVLDFGRS